MRARRTLVPVVAAVLLAAACTSPQEPAAPAPPAAPTMVTSTNVYGSIARAVGGDRVTVESLVDDPAADPHSYEPTAAAAAAVGDASIVVYNGGGYDDWMSQLIESAGGQPEVIDVSELSGLEPTTEPAEGEGEFNEHVWYSLPTVQALATRLATVLGTADPANSAEYTANAEELNREIDGLIQQADAIGVQAPGARVAVTEPVPGYLIDEAGLMNVTPEEFAEAIEEDTDPPAAVVQETLALFSGEPVRALVLNVQTQTPTTDQVRRAATTAGVPVVEVSETLPAGQDEYVGWMSAQIDALGAAVTRAGSP